MFMILNNKSNHYWKRHFHGQRLQHIQLKLIFDRVEILKHVTSKNASVASWDTQSQVKGQYFLVKNIVSSHITITRRLSHRNILITLAFCWNETFYSFLIGLISMHANTFFSGNCLFLNSVIRVAPL